MPHPAVYAFSALAVVATALYAYFAFRHQEEPHSYHSKKTDDWQFYDTSSTCSICLDDCKINAAYLSCGHCYHRQCIEQWLSYNDRCPNCKEPARIV